MLEEVLQGLGVSVSSDSGSARTPPASISRPLDAAKSVMRDENRGPRRRVFVDGTFGRGGHTRALLGTPAPFAVSSFVRSELFNRFIID
jgi:16S rRNA C1402 N4-methylase RsmH